MFHAVIQNMRSLARIKHGTLGYSYLLMARRDEEGEVLEHNFDEAFAAAVLAKEIGCDYFELKPAYDMNHYLIGLTVQLQKVLTAQMTQLLKIEDGRFKVVFPGTLETVLRGEPLVEGKPYDRCLVAELRTLLSSNGAYVCPYYRGDQSRSYGNPRTTSLRDLWNGPLRQTVMARTNPSRDCRFHCIRHSSNQELLRIGDARNSSSACENRQFDPFL
jgi:hypothetical protein